MRIFLGALIFSFVAFADPAHVVNEGAVIFTQPDFDSDPMAQLHEGEKIEISKRVFGAFHRVRLKDGRLGYIADNDYKKGVPPKGKAFAEKSEAEIAQDVKQAKKRRRPFAATKYRGVSYMVDAYRETTMTMTPTAATSFYGFKMVGPDLVFDGDTVTEVNVNISPSAPTYYQQATGNSANGWILHTDILMEEVFSQGKNVLTFIGFGPMFRYSSYQVGLTSSPGHVNNYSLQDMALGAVFNTGFGFRIGSVALRGEYHYYWEKSQYWGYGLSLLFPF